MTDVDRLRAAAHILDTVSYPTPFSTTCAVLLRAVADGVHNGASLGHKTVKAALALASVILGAES